VRLTVQGPKMLLEKGEATIGKGKVTFSGECRDFLTRRRSTALKAGLRAIEVHDVVPIGTREKDFSLYGLLNADLQLAFSGTTQAGDVRSRNRTDSAMSSVTGSAPELRPKRRPAGELCKGT